MSDFDPDKILILLAVISSQDLAEIRASFLTFLLLMKKSRPFLNPGKKNFYLKNYLLSTCYVSGKVDTIENTVFNLKNLIF